MDPSYSQPSEWVSPHEARLRERIAELEAELRKWLHWSFQHYHGAHPLAGKTRRLLGGEEA